MPKFALGIMSGTSGDGVSLAFTSFQGRKMKVLAHHTFPYPASLQNLLAKAVDLKTPQISMLHVLLGNYFADCAVRFLKKCGPKSSRIAVIGSHGHTLYHEGDSPQKRKRGQSPFHTLQIGEPSFIAEKTGLPVVADFRMRDLAAGGEGAPLIPFFDQFFFWKRPFARTPKYRRNWKRHACGATGQSPCL